MFFQNISGYVTLIQVNLGYVSKGEVSSYTFQFRLGQVRQV